MSFVLDKLEDLMTDYDIRFHARPRRFVMTERTRQYLRTLLDPPFVPVDYDVFCWADVPVKIDDDLFPGEVIAE